jgi:hypothetical protein
MSHQVRAFTSRYAHISRVLGNVVQVSPAFDHNGATQEQLQQYSSFNAIWDTGATSSVITQQVVDRCCLKPIGMAEVAHAVGKELAEVYFVNIGLPNGVAFMFIRAIKGKLVSGDVLIGMDIISQGDFAVTNKDNKTVFSFRMPSVECIDFVQSHPIHRTESKVGRNEPCPCGSGKKYKKCCGK